MRAIILGGNGYIGRSLIEQAFKKKFKIINIDIKSQETYYISKIL